MMKGGKFYQSEKDGEKKGTTPPTQRNHEVIWTGCQKQEKQEKRGKESGKEELNLKNMSNTHIERRVRRRKTFRHVYWGRGGYGGERKYEE